MSECIEWTGSISPNGYGKVEYNGRTTGAHRVAYEQEVGPIPEGLQIDHLCRNRACVNVEHLEAVTCRENLLRGEGITAKNAAKTHCPQGHPYFGPNLYVDPTGGRQCRVCRRYRNRTVAARRYS